MRRRLLPYEVDTEQVIEEVLENEDSDLEANDIVDKSQASN